MTRCAIAILSIAWITLFIACGGGASDVGGGRSILMSPPPNDTPAITPEPKPEPIEEATPTSTYDTAEDTATHSDVIRRAKDAVRTRLKFPHDAEFDWFPPIGKMKDGRWACNGKVKAANAFGAKLTHEYTVILSCRDKATKSWRVDLVQLGEEILYVSPEQIQIASGVDPDRAAGDERLAAKERADQEALEAIGREFMEAQQQKIEDAKWRTWTSADGAFSTEAKFISFLGNKVKLEKRDGKVITVAIDVLTADDAAFIRGQKWLKAGVAE